MELTLRGWGNADADKRRILSKKDLVTSCYESDMYDFLVDVIPPQKQSQSKSKSKSRPQPQPLPQPQSQSQSHLARIPHATTQAQTMHEQRYLQQLQQQQLQLQQQQQLQQQLQLQQEHILIPQSTTLPIDAHAMALYYQHLQQTEPQIQIPTLPQQVQVQKHNHQQTNALPQNDIQQINSQVRSSEAELAPWQTAVGAHALSPPPQANAHILAAGVCAIFSYSFISCIHAFMHSLKSVFCCVRVENRHWRPPHRPPSRGSSRKDTLPSTRTPIALLSLGVQTFRAAVVAVAVAVVTLVVVMSAVAMEAITPTCWHFRLLRLRYLKLRNVNSVDMAWTFAACQLHFI